MPWNFSKPYEDSLKIVWMLYPFLAVGCCTSSLAGSVFINDWSISCTNSRYRDCQTLCLQPARCGTYIRQTELALFERYLWDAGIWHAGKLKKLWQWTIWTFTMWQWIIWTFMMISLVYWVLGCSALYVGLSVADTSYSYNEWKRNCCLRGSLGVCGAQVVRKWGSLSGRWISSGNVRRGLGFLLLAWDLTAVLGIVIGMRIWAVLLCVSRHVPLQACLELSESASRQAFWWPFGAASS